MSEERDRIPAESYCSSCKHLEADTDYRGHVGCECKLGLMGYDGDEPYALVDEEENCEGFEPNRNWYEDE